MVATNYSNVEVEKLHAHVRALASERDNLFHNWVVDLGHEVLTNNSSISDGIHSNHMAVELADWKARLRRIRQEL